MMQSVVLSILEGVILGVCVCELVEVGGRDIMGCMCVYIAELIEVY